MLSGNGLEVGSVFARIGALFDDDGFDKWRRAVKDVREEAKREVKPDLEADFNARGFEQFERALSGAHREATKDVKPDLGADYNERGFGLFTRALRGAREEASRDVTTDLKADVDRRGFTEYERALRSARNESDITTRAGIRTGNGFVSVGKSAAGAAVAFLGTYGLVEGVRSLFTAYRDSEKVQKQTEAVLRSTGEEANVTGSHVEALATKFSHLAATDDEAVQSGENMLLTFTNIRNEVGKGNNIFDQASLTILNMSTALDQDLKSSAIQLGKALNEPIKGMTALQRVGVAFTESTKERITKLVEEGKTLAAQKIILRELNKEFGGSAKAAGEGASGFDKLSVAAENLEEKIGGKLAPTLSSWANAVADFLDSLSGSGGKGGGAQRAGAAVGKVVSQIGHYFSTFRDEASDIAHTVGRLVSGIGDAFKDVFSGRSGIGGDLSKIGLALRAFSEAVLRVFNAVVKRALPGIVSAFHGFFLVVRGIIRVIAGLLTLDFGKAWEGVKDIFGGGIEFILGSIRAVTAPMRELVSKVGQVMIDGLGGAWDFIEGIFKDGLEHLIGLFTGFLRGIATALGASPDIPGIPDPQDASNKINDLADSLDGYRESLRGVSKEEKTSKERTEDHVAALKRERRELKATGASTDELRRNKKALREAERNLTDSTKKTADATDKADNKTRSWKGTLKQLLPVMRNTKDRTKDFHNEVRDPAPASAFAKGLKRLIRGSGNFQGALGRAVEFVKEATDKALKGFGAKPLDFVVQAVKDVGDLMGFARGGFIGRRGQKGADKRLVLAGDGEAFFNGDQIPYVEHALRRTFGVSLPQFFSGRKWRPHQQTRGYAEGGVVGNIGAMISEADRIDKLHIPYVWGGSHGQSPTPMNGPFDCSSAVSHILQVGGYGNPTMVSGQLAGFGAPGPGPVTIYANPEHTFMKLLGRFWGTSRSNPGGGPGWLEGGYPTGGFTVSHPTAANAGSIPKLKIKGPDGPYKTILQGAADRMVDGANAYVQKNAGFGGGDFNLPGGQMPQPEIERLWRSVNPALGDAHLMSAIAMQESHGFVDIVGHDPGGTEGLGLWQITTGYNDGLIASLGGRDAMFDPETNAEAAAHILRSSGLGAWVAYTSGDYQQFMEEGGLVGGGGNLLTFAKGGVVKGKGGKGKKAAGPSIGAAEPAGPVHVAEMGPLEAHLGQDGGQFVAHQEGHLADLESDYSYWERRFNLSEEEFIVEGKDGEPILNRDAIKRRVSELKKLLEIRKAIIAVRNREIAFAKRTIELLRPVIKALKQGLNAAQSKTAKEKWRDALQKYTGQLTSWKGQLDGWQRDKRERILDRDEVVGQLKALAPGGSVETEYEEAVADFGEGGEGLGGGEGEGGGEGGEGAPTPEQIATAAREQLNEFQAQRASLYGEFGSNFVPAGTVPFQTAMQQAAGMRYYGVAGNGAPLAGGLPALIAAAKKDARHGGGGVLFQLKQDFKAPPPDPHTWTKSVLFELGAQL
jgi:hypothetical protein